MQAPFDPPSQKFIFYGRRQTRGLSKQLKAYKEADKKNILLDIDALANLPPSRRIEACFADFVPKRIWLEIGIGSGEHLIDLAKAHPEDGFIGAEAYQNGVARALRDADMAGLVNICLFDDDVRKLLCLLPPKVLDFLMVMFPDPWPKRRHRMRRMVGPILMPVFTALLKTKGEFRFASDHPQTTCWALSFFNRAPEFTLTANAPTDWNIRPPDWPNTRYEQKRLAGQPQYFSWHKQD